MKALLLRSPRRALALAALFVLLALCSRPVSAQGPIASGQTLVGEIVPTSDVDGWTFHADAGDAIVIRVGEISEAGSFRPKITLLNPLAVTMDTRSSNIAAEIAVTATVSGVHTVVVEDLNGTSATGVYRLTLVRSGVPATLFAGDEGGPLTNGAVHTGTIGVGELDIWTLTANAGDAMVARMGEVTSASPLSPQLRIYSPTGARLDLASSAVASEVVATADTSGLYLVVAGDFNSTNLVGSGDYRLSLAMTGSPVVVSPGDEGGPLTNGALHTGTIETGGLDVWTVTANLGEAIVVRMGEVVGGSSLSPQLRIFSPTGAQVGPASSAFAAEVVATAAATGTYLVVAADGNSTNLIGSGDYRLSLAKTGSSVVVSPGDEGGPLDGPLKSGVIEVGDLDVWTLVAGAGSTIWVTMEEAIAASDLSPSLRLYDPDGDLLQSSTGTALAQISEVAPTTGTYLVVAGDQNTTALKGEGPYWLGPSAALDAGAPTPAPNALSFAAPSPNPARGASILEFHTATRGPVRVEIFDIAGRRVVSLADREMEATTVRLRWDGRDAEGRDVAPGVYLVRVTASSAVITRRIVRIR